MCKEHSDGWWLQNTTKAGKALFIPHTFAKRETWLIWYLMTVLKGLSSVGMEHKADWGERGCLLYEHMISSVLCGTKTQSKGKFALFYIRNSLFQPVVVRPSGSLFWVPWLTPINTWVPRSVLFWLLSCSEALGLELSLLPSSMKKQNLLNPMRNMTMLVSSESRAQISLDNQISLGLAWLWTPS